MTVGELLERMTARELQLWAAFMSKTAPKLPT